MKKKMVGLLIAFIIVIGFTHPVGPVNGDQITPLEYGVGGL